MIYPSFHSLLFFAWLFLLMIQRGSSITFWVAPVNVNPPMCVSPICFGLSPLNPFDNIQYAFRDGINAAIKAKENSVTFNLIANQDIVVPFKIFMNEFQASPFENYNGKITIQGTYPTDLIAATYVNSIAAILLQIEDFTLVVRNQLTLKYVAFEAIDIHIDFGIGCPQLADPILCTCYGPNINTTLYSTTSTCSVLNKEAVLLNKVYSGFIQLNGTTASSKPTLITNNFGVLNFNAFKYHITFISILSQNSSLQIKNTTIQQAYFAKSLFNCEIAGANLNINIDGFLVTKLNDYYVKELRYYNPLAIFNFKSTNGFISVNLMQIELLYREGIQIFVLDNSLMQLTVSLFELKNTNFFDPLSISTIEQGMDLIFNHPRPKVQVFVVSNSKNRVNYLNISMIMIHDFHILFQLGSYTKVNLYMGLSEVSQIIFNGPLIVFNCSGMVFGGLLTPTFDLMTPLAYGAQLLIKDCWVLFPVFGFYRSYARSLKVKVSNLTVFNGLETIWLEGGSQLNAKCIYEFEQVVVKGITSIMGGLLYFNYYARVSIKNSILSNIDSKEGLGGLLIVNGVGNVIAIDNVTAFNAKSQVFGAFLTSVMNGNEFTVSNSLINNIHTEFDGNLMLDTSSFTAINTTFGQFTSKIGSFAMMKAATLTFINVTFNSAYTQIEGFIYAVNSKIYIQNSTFIDLSGKEANFILAMDSSIILDKVVIKDCQFKDSLIKMVQSTLQMTNSKISNTSNGVIIYCDLNNLVQVLNSSFQDILVEENGMLYLKTSNTFTLTNSIIANLKCTSTNGGIINTSNQNVIVVTNLTCSHTTTDGRGSFYIFMRSTFVLTDSYFVNTTTKISGGVIYVTNATLTIQSTFFISCSSKEAGFMYAKDTNVTIENCTAKMINSDGILGKYLNLIMTACSFEVSDMNYAIQVTNELEINDISFVSVQNCDFKRKEGILSGYATFLIYFEEIQIVNMKNINFVNNIRTNAYLLEFQNCNNTEMENIVYNQNQAARIFEIKNDNNLYMFTLSMSDIIFDSNSFSECSFEINGNFTITFDNITFISNIKTTAGGLIFLSALNVALFSQITVKNNLGHNDVKIYTNFVFIVTNCKSLVFDAIDMENNEYQFLQAQISKISIVSSFFVQNSICRFIMIEQTNLILINSIFKGNNGLLVDYCLLNKNATTIEAFNSSLHFEETSFLTTQSSYFVQNDLVKNVTNYLKIDQTEIKHIVGDSLIIKSCLFSNELYFTVIALELQSVAISSSLFQVSTVSLKNPLGGGLLQFLGIYSSFVISDSQFTNLGKETSISCLTLDNSNIDPEVVTLVTIDNCQFSGNLASSGGALSLSGKTRTYLSNSHFFNNSAISTSALNPSFGGCLLFFCPSNASCELHISKCIMEDSTADLGGCIYLFNSQITELNDLTLSDCFSKVTNDMNHSIMTNPYYLTIKGVQSTQGYNFIYYGSTYNNLTETISVNSGENFLINFLLYDVYHNLSNFTIPISETASIQVFDTSSSATVKQGVSYFSGSQLTFSSFSLSGFKKQKYEMELVMAGPFNVTKKFTISMRNCSKGEYYDDFFQQCKACPNSTYSFNEPQMVLNSDGTMNQEGPKICHACPENANCNFTDIIPKANYWMNDSMLNTLVVKCPIENTCLEQDRSVSIRRLPIKCAEGYSGPLCVECDDGYAKDNYISKCRLCSWKLGDIFTLIGKLAFILFFVVQQITSAIKKHDVNDVQSSAIIVKIVRDHFNQIFLISSFSTIFKLDPKYTVAYETANDIVTGSALNFDCIYKKNFSLDIFYFKIINALFSPILMVVFISFSFFLYYIYKKFFLKKRVKFLYLVKTLLISLIVICDTLYTQILVNFLKFFDCVQLDSENPHTFLRFSPNIQCFSYDHMQKIYEIGLPGFIVWILGLPVTFFLVLFYFKGKSLKKMTQSQKSSLSQNTEQSLNFDSMVLSQKKKPAIKIFEKNLDTNSMLNFLIYDYNQKHYYWSSVIMIWKTVISGMITFINDDGIYIHLGTFYVFLMLLYSVCKPYKYPSTEKLIQISLFCNFLSITLGEYVTNVPEYKNELVFINLSFHLLFFGFAASIYVREYTFAEQYEKLIVLLSKHEGNRYVKKILTQLRSLEKFTIIKTRTKKSETNTESMLSRQTFQSPGFETICSPTRTLTSPAVERKQTLDKWGKMGSKTSSFKKSEIDLESLELKDKEEYLNREKEEEKGNEENSSKEESEENKKVASLIKNNLGQSGIIKIDEEDSEMPNVEEEGQRDSLK